MKDKSFVVKIGDLLQEGGKTDSFDFDQKLSSELPNLSKNGISGTVILHSLNTDSVYVTTENISCELNESCDRCLAEYIRKIDAPEYKVRFVMSEKIKEEEQESSEEELFVISSRDETINLEPVIVQAIKLNDPFIKHCPKCEKEIESSEDEDFDESNTAFGNVIFRKS